MKTIGLIGGMSWESTIPYYRIINQTVQNSLGGLHSAKIMLFSVDFHHIAELQSHANWIEAGKILANAARTLEQAGADVLVLCTNTMHKVASDIEAAVTIPLLHIADPTAMTIKATALTKIGLLGTRFTMEQDFYRQRLQTKHGLEVIIPDEADRQIIHDIIYHELCQGKIVERSRNAYQQIIQKLEKMGAQAIILGCTEIGLLIQTEQASLPLFDTATIHAQYAAAYALENIPQC